MIKANLMTSTADDVCEENTLKAMQNEYVVEHLFSFLSVNDIKNCRLASRIWRNVGAQVLRRKTRVVFDFGEVGLGLVYVPIPHEKAMFLEKKKRMKEVSDYCKENTPESTPISSFEFLGGFEYFHLTDFLDDVRGHTTKLKIISEIYHGKFEIKTVDISPKISPNITKLHIELLTRYHQSTISLCLDQISFVKDIYLDGCSIILDGNEKRLSPSNITLGPGNKYIKNETEVKYLVNENFDLQLTKIINLDGKNLIVDFSDCVNDQVRRNVKLKNVTVRNWEMCNWKIKEFSLNGIPFLEENFIEVEELKTENLTIDLSKIYNPTSLLRLYCEDHTIIAAAPFFLPNLVDVTLGCQKCVVKLPYFTNNTNISKMCLQKKYYDEDRTLSVNINDLPKGINELRLTAVGVHGEGVYPLQTLNMEAYNPFVQYSIFGAKFRSETFRIWDSRNWNDRISIDEELERVTQLSNLTGSYDRLVIIGGMYMLSACIAHNNSQISKYMDRDGNIVFEGKRRKVLTEEADMEHDC